MHNGVSSKYPCPKCGSKEFTMGEVYMAGSKTMKVFNIQNRKFTTFTCLGCSYTEFYQVPMRRALNVLDFFVG